MPTANEQLLGATVDHGVNLTRYGNDVVRRIIAILNEAERAMFAELVDALERLPRDSFTVQRLDQVLGSVLSVNGQAYDQVQREMMKELRDHSAYETGFQSSLFAQVLPPQVSFAAVSAEQAYSAALARPFQGRLLSEWTASLEQAVATRVRDTVRIGYVENKTTDEIVRTLRGTRANGYLDGALQIDARNAEAVVRTAVGHFAAAARDQFQTANADLIATLQWVSTLDTRTTLMCIVRDGHMYSVDEPHEPLDSPWPWGGGPGNLHWQCRSTSVPVLKSWDELTGENIDSFTPDQRASMDGAVPASQTYSEWLTKQSAARQDEILGPSRGKLFRDGGMTVDRFVNDKGRTITLDELRKRDAEAFDRAGL